MSWADDVSGQGTMDGGYDVLITEHDMQSVWEKYRVAPPLTRVWSGDDPAKPASTVQLLFADFAQAQAVLASLWVPD